MNKRNKLIYKICCAAFLAAASAVIAYFCKYLTFAGGNIRITFENLPIILSGILLGPVFGGATGILADLISTSVSSYAINPLITLGAGAVGAVAGISFRFLRGKVKVPLTVLFSHIIGNMIVKSIALKIMYMTPLPLLMLRIPISIAEAVFESILLVILLKNKAIGKVIKNDLR